MRFARAVVKSFLAHRDTDVAAALTYYSVLSIFPAALALLSVLAVVGEAESSLNTVLDLLDPLVSDATLADLEPVLRDLVMAGGASWTLLVGVLVALWSASAYVGAFGRAMNTVHEVEETRPIWKLRPLMLLVTLATIVFNAIALVMIVATGPIAESVGGVVGLGDTFLDVWDVAKWPVLAIVVMIVVSLLYHATPNVKTGWRILTVGSFVAILVWAAASAGFAFYVANFASYNKTYGSVAGVIIALLWLWLTNVALLFGAEIDVAREKADPPPPADPSSSVEPPPSVEPAETTGPGVGKLDQRGSSGFGRLDQRGPADDDD